MTDGNTYAINKHLNDRGGLGRTARGNGRA